MTVTFVETDLTETNEFGVFKNDYTACLTGQMDENEEGFFISKQQQPVILNHCKPKRKRFVKGYDFGSHNVLSKEQKIIDCSSYMDKENAILYVAFTYASDDIGCDVFLYRIDLKNADLAKIFNDAHQNIFDILKPERLTFCGKNGRLIFNENDPILSWEHTESTADDKCCEKIFYHLISGEIRKESSSNANKTYHRYIDDYRAQTLSRTDKKVRYERVEGDLYVAVIEPKYKQGGKKYPAIMICLGGPNIMIPDFYADHSIYDLFSCNGFYIICPLRRGVIGINYEWEHSLEGHCGKEDTNDLILGTHYILEKYSEEIDAERIGLYGGSYGGFSAFLINGKYNNDRMFKAVIAHCGVFNLETYPKECHGKATDVMMGYADTDEKTVYAERIKAISPHYFVENWNTATLIIHSIDDSSVWFGQSVKAYNAALEHGKEVKLILTPGPHSYKIKGINVIFKGIIDFFKEQLSCN